MLMADVLAVFFVVLGLLLAHVGVWLLCRGLWSGHVERASAQVSDNLVLTLLAGVVPVLGALVFGIVLSQVAGGIGKAAAALFASAFLLYAHAGLAGAVAEIGRTLGSRDELPWRSIARGGVALTLAFVFPILGWFVLLPLSIVLGAGASSIALVRGFVPRTIPSARAALS